MNEHRQKEVSSVQPFQQVYEEYYEMVYRFLLRLCGNQALAEELCQETFYQAQNWIDFGTK